MATSESEEFESADEDLDMIPSALQKNAATSKTEDDEDDIENRDFENKDLQAILSVKENSSEQHLTVQMGDDNTRRKKIDSEQHFAVINNEDNVGKKERDSEICVESLEHDLNASHIKESPDIDDKDTNTNSGHKVKREKKRPQRTGEIRKSNVKKKLGTKITATPESVKLDLSDNYGSNILNEEKHISSGENQKNNETFQNLTNSQKLMYQHETDTKTQVHSESLDVNVNTEIASVLEKLSGPATQKEDDSWGGWGNWGVTSLLSSATEGVSSLTSHVSHGLSSVLETGIGIPNPEELARLDQERELQQKKKDTDMFSANSSGDKQVNRPETQTENEGSFFGLSHVISGVTKLVETTGSKVITGGLDTLETIGKKTMEVLQEGDPGLKKKRELFSDKIILSQVLREAKEKAELEDKVVQDKEAMRKAHFETLFDDYQGLVHLEALEMLSKQCELKIETVLQALKGQVVVELEKRLTALKDQCEIPDEDDVNEEGDMGDDWLGTLGSSFTDLGILISTEKINKTWEETKQVLSNEGSEIKPREIHQKAMATLARLTAESVELFHKSAELLLVKGARDPFQEAHCLQEITMLLSSCVNCMAGKFSDVLNSCDSMGAVSISDLITNIFFEASNSSSYLKEAFQLTVPVLQFALLP